jgi:archaellum component FlaG (FlaF/FlaG flagellin family)
MRRFIHLSLLAAAVSLFAGCSTPSAVPSKSVAKDPNGNLHLYVSNQSFAISPVDIKVLIDGELVVDGLFEVGSQHSWQTFVLRLSSGRHKIVVESSKGQAKLEQVFEVGDKAWAALTYWFDSKVKEGHFVLDVKDKPIYFM